MESAENRFFVTGTVFAAPVFHLFRVYLAGCRSPVVLVPPFTVLLDGADGTKHMKMWIGYTALAGVVTVLAVILAIQSLPGTVGGRSNSGLSCASFRLRDAQMQSYHWLSVPSPFLILRIKKDRQLFASCDQRAV